MAAVSAAISRADWVTNTLAVMIEATGIRIVN
jgi:hypothetical protein